MFVQATPLYFKPRGDAAPHPPPRDLRPWNGDRRSLKANRQIITKTWKTMVAVSLNKIHMYNK